MDEHDDDVSGELIDEPRLTAADSEFRPGDRVFFRLRHPAFRSKLPELAGLIIAVLPGTELTYVIKVASSGRLPWPDLFVRRGDILRAWI